MRRKKALTLLELLVVLAVLVALVSIVVPLVTDMSDGARETATLASMRQVQELILDRYRLDMAGLVTSSDTLGLVQRGFPGPDASHLVPAGRQQHPQLCFLFVNPLTNTSQATFDPATARGWRGPYLLRSRHGVYPGLDASTAVARGFDGQFGEIGDDTILDGWGNPIIIQLGTNSLPALFSAGPDGRLATSDDLVLILQ